jgi:VWFA-related protein
VRHDIISGDLPSYLRRLIQEFFSVRLRGQSLRILFFSATFWACAAPSFTQEQGPPRQVPDVVRINTSLVQTDVMVFDKQGSFVDGLKRDQFVLKIDGKPREISFFEKVVAGSRNEEAQLAAARGNSSGGVGAGDKGVVPLDRGRTIYFFVDDLHLSPGSNRQTRLLLQRFIEREMGQNDEAAITSTSGQIGFLQQLTDDKTVLHAAAERLLAKSFATKDSQRPVMTEYQAELIEAQNEDVMGFFVDELIRLNPLLPRNMAAAEIQGRASQISQQTAYLTNGTLNSLKTLVKNSAALPGRKLVFFISDGFLLNNKNSDNYDRLRQIVSAAAASGVTIYSIDARGLSSGMPDAMNEIPFDPSGRLTRGAAGELTAMQDGLNSLAADTGGRAFLNSNDLSAGVTTALKETSTYYLLAWRPEGEEQRNQKSRRLEVSVTGRPDLSVRFHHGFGDSSSSEKASPPTKQGETTPKPPNELMREAMGAAYPKSDLPVAISLNFLDLAQLGPTLTTSIKISSSSLVLETQAGQLVATMDLAGGVYDDQGKPVSSFNKHLTIRSKSNDPKTPPPDNVFFSHFCTIKPGLYQVRVAAVDAKQGRAGSAVRWIEIPDPTSKALTLSSLIVGERKTELEAEPSVAESSELSKSPEPIRQVSLNIDHRFARSSHLRFVTFVYNATGTLAAAAPTPMPSGQGTSEPANSLPVSSTSTPGNGPDLAVQVQLFRDNEPVMTMPLHKISIDALSDARRLPYAAEVDLGGLQPGRYLLLVTVIDRVAKASASRKFGFRID